MYRTLVLSGAGASLDFGAPSTSEIGEKLDKLVGETDWERFKGTKELYFYIKERLQGYLAHPGAVNFEQVYHCVHELIQFAPPRDGAVDEFKFLLNPFFTLNKSFEESSLRALEAEIIKIVYESVSASCDNSKQSLKPFSELISSIAAKGVIRFYTTNYDDFALQAYPNFFIGFDRKPQSKFEASDFWASRLNDNCLFHLHGSIHFGFPHSPDFEIGEIGWFENRAEALKYSHFGGSTSDERRMDGSSVQRTAVLTGLDKLSRIQHSPMNHYYSAFAQDAMQADLIVLIGAGLTDLHLNTWLKASRKKNPQTPIVIVDYFDSGFSGEFDYSRKHIDLLHCLGIQAFEPLSGVEKDGHWTFIPKSKAAIWDAGFWRFLNDSATIEEVLGRIDV